MRLGASWIDDVAQVINTLVPKGASIDLGTPTAPFRNLYLSGDQVTAGNLAVTGDLTVTGSTTSLTYLLGDSSPLNYNLSVYAAGTAYQLTDTSAALDFGTTDPVLTLDKAGTYLITGNVNLLYNAATFAASETVTLKFRRTNNTPADLSNGSLATETDIITTLTYTFGSFALPSIIYSTSNINDAITIFADVSTEPSAGSLDAVAASIVAVRLDAYVVT